MACRGYYYHTISILIFASYTYRFLITRITNTYVNDSFHLLVLACQAHPPPFFLNKIRKPKASDLLHCTYHGVPRDLDP